MIRLPFAARIVAAVGIATFSISIQGSIADAAEIKIISAAGVRPVLDELGARYERKTGHKLVIKYMEGPLVKRAIDSGEPFEVVLSLAAVIDDLIKQGKIAADTRADFARTGMGVGVRAGAAKPDIGSVDAFKRALLNARSVTFAGEGATGLYFVALLERLGIGEQMKSKLKPMQSPAPLLAVAKGEAEIVVGVISPILAASGVELVGPLPSELQTYIRFSAGVGTAAAEPNIAKALVRFLTSPDAALVIKAKGMEPM